VETPGGGGSETVSGMDLSPDQHAALDKITAELAAAAGPALPGTLTVRAYACGKTRCRCHADPPQLHGPYAEWTRKIGGKTITRRLTDAELADWQPLFDNARKLRTLLAQLQDLTLAIIEGQPGQGPIAQTGQNPVGSARLTCGRGRCRPSSTQLSAKREDLTIFRVLVRLKVTTKRQRCRILAPIPSGCRTPDRARRRGHEHPASSAG
jgi:hypothetical protein